MLCPPGPRLQVHALTTIAVSTPASGCDGVVTVLWLCCVHLQVHVSSLPYANMYDIVQATATLEDFVRDHMPDSCGGGDATTGNPANIAGNQSSVAQREQPRRPTPCKENLSTKRSPVP